MKEFFKPTLFKITFFLLWVLFIFFTKQEIFRPSFTSYNWLVTKILFWPSQHFSDFGVWIWLSANPGIKESTESLEPGFRLISNLIVWPLMLIYIYSVVSIIYLVYKKILKRIRVFYV